MKLLVCIDGSELSLAALEPARKMAAATAAEVHLLRVLDVSGVHEKTRGKMAPNRRVQAVVPCGRRSPCPES